jgi:hypothetical protein
MTIDDRKIRRFRRMPGIREEQLDEVLFLINEDARSIHALLPVGAGVWEVLAETATQRDIVEVLTEAFPAVSRNRVAGDVRTLVEDFLDAGLIAEVDAREAIKPN